MSMIFLKNITKIYGKGSAEVKALSNVSLNIEKGEMVAIIGTSGSGKSTLLNILGCLDLPTCGEYYLEDKNINSCSSKESARLRNEKFGFVVQDFALIERYTVKKNVLLPLTYSHKKISQEQIDNIFSKLGILEKKKVYANTLSGGQRQRVAIARAIINDPDIILADEPTGSLDTKNSGEVINILRELNSDGKTIILVTHDMQIAKSCSRIIQIEDGKIYTA